MLTALLLQLTYGLLLLTPAAALILDFARERRRDSTRTSLPFDELQRRPAGESTRLRIEKLDEDIEAYLAWILIVPIALALGLSLQPRRDLVVGAWFFLIVVIVTAVAQRKLCPLRRDRRAHVLGFQGERYVAEELNLLIADGFDVFHDVPFDKFNIDHVLLGPRGVFVIETKTRRKPLKDGRKQGTVKFDGAALEFPTFRGTEALEQAVRNRKSMAKWLSAATGDRWDADAILTIPGWFVETTKPSTQIQVLNPKQIRSAVLSRPVRIDKAMIQRARYQLEHKCKLSIA